MKNDNFDTLPMDDPHLVDSIERGLQRYKGLLSPAMVEHIRREALLQLSVHPYSVALVRAMKEPAAVHQSDDRLISKADDDEGARSSGGEGRSR